MLEWEAIQLKQMSRGILWLSLPPFSDQLVGVRLAEGFEAACHLHVTLQFGIDYSSVDPEILGATVEATAIELCYNDRIQALRVALPESFAPMCQNANPHMTLGHLPGVKPFESNAMLSSEHTSHPYHLPLNLIVEFFEFQQ